VLTRVTKSLAFLAILSFSAQVAQAQQSQNGQWFVPGQGKASPAAPRPAARPAPASSPNSGGMPIAGQAPEAEAPAVQVPLPPAPEFPTLAKVAPPPAAVVGILSVPDILRVSTAYQAAYKELNARGQKLNEDAQKEQNALREMGQAFANERGKLSPEQIRAKEKEITNRATEAQRKFGERNRIIQEAGQYVMAQMNRTVEQAAQQVAASRGVNIVLNGAQILGGSAEFDLTPAVAELVNKVLPTVVVPPDGVSPLQWVQPAAAANPPAKP